MAWALKAPLPVAECLGPAGHRSAITFLAPVRLRWMCPEIHFSSSIPLMPDYESRAEGSLNAIHSLQTGTGSWPLSWPLYCHPDSKMQQGS